MARATVFLSDDLLRAVDAEAEREGISRSALCQKAAEAYLDQAKRERQEVERRRAMEEACLRMDKLAEKLGNWDPVAIVRQFREPRRGSRTRRYCPRGLVEETSSTLRRREIVGPAKGAQPATSPWPKLGGSLS